MPYTTLISTAELAEHLASSWVIADCRYDLHADHWGQEQYVDAHIPGGVHVSLSRDLSSQPNGTNGRHPPGAARSRRKRP